MPYRGHIISLCPAIAVMLFIAGHLYAETPAHTQATGHANIPGYWVPRHPPRANYRIDCSINPAKGTLEGAQVVKFRNTSSRPIGSLALQCMAYGNQILEVIGNGQPASIATGIEARPIVFSLAEPVPPGRTLTLEIKFKISTPTPSNVPRKIKLVDWHPRLWWGFDTHDDYEVTLKTPPGYAVGSSGFYDQQKDLYRAEATRSFGIFLARDHEVLEARTGNVTVRCLYPPKAKECAELLVKTATDVIRFYREFYGLYPYRNLTIIPGQDRPVGGYPVATALVAIHGMERMPEKSNLHWRWITAHEIGHQYWGEYVIEKDTPDWLWIGMGIYADRAYSRARGLGTEKHAELMGRYLQGIQREYDTTINRSLEERRHIEFDFNNVVIHGKGYSVISALDCVLGNKLFEGIQRRCLKEFPGRRLGAAEFRAVCEQESGRDLAWFFDQWIDSNRVLSYEITAEQCEKKGTRYISQITVKRLGDLTMPLPVEARFKDDTRQRQFTDRLLEIQTVRFESPSPLTQVSLDPDKVLPLAPPPGFDEEKLMEKIGTLPWVGAGPQTLDFYKEAQKHELSHSSAWFKLALILYDGKYDQPALRAFEKVEKYAQIGSNREFTSIVWQGHLLDLMGKRPEALRHYQRALPKAGTHQMRHDQYVIKIDRAWVEQRLKEPFHRQ